MKFIMQHEIHASEFTASTSTTVQQIICCCTEAYVVVDLRLMSCSVQKNSFSCSCGR